MPGRSLDADWSGASSNFAKRSIFYSNKNTRHYVAAAGEELSASISEITGQITRTAAVAGKAIEDVHHGHEQMSQLAEVGARVGDVVTLIREVADQTGLLALNATIEAARAGAAGRGFAVVASEVKALASQTARATEEIAQRITDMQAGAQRAGAAITQISARIEDLNEIASTIASAVEEQMAVTAEVAANITAVSDAARTGGQSAGALTVAADALTAQANGLGSEVEHFLQEVRSF